MKYLQNKKQKMNEENTQTNQENLDTVGVKTELKKEEEELKQYTQQRIANVLETVMKNPNNRYWTVKRVHASGHGWQKINHWNSKAQLHFNIDNFYNDFNIKDKTWEDFVKIVWEKNITRDQSTLTLENQETRYASKNKDKALEHLKAILLELFKEEKERIQTEISHEQKEKRLKEKWKRSEKKWRRKKIRPQDDFE